jgi:quinol---cytochrome c reductase iron-sulfur subunit, bacillus type
MPHSNDSLPNPGRRLALAAFVNGFVALAGGALSTLLAWFALRPPAAAGAGRWVQAGPVGELKPGVPQPRVLSVPRVDGWYRERAQQTVFLVADEAGAVRALSATCTHLGCQVRWDGDAKQFRCPCHGGVYDASGRVVSGPPPRPLETVEARVDPAANSVLVRL